MRNAIARAWRGKHTKVVAFAAPWAVATFDGGHIASLPHAPGARGAQSISQVAIEHQPICIGSSVASAGQLSDTLYYRAVDRGDGHLTVGYFAFFSEERPWGNNWMTWSVVPALAIDLVYSRALLVAPGLQRVLFGAGDVEGVGVTYTVLANGTLDVDHAWADNESHSAVALTRADVLAIDASRPTFYSDVWSHQLGARGIRTASDLAYVHCYGDGAIRPLPDGLAREFRIEDHNRAPPAHVDRAGGRRLDLAESISAPTPPRG